MQAADRHRLRPDHRQPKQKSRTVYGTKKIADEALAAFLTDVRTGLTTTGTDTLKSSARSLARAHRDRSLHHDRARLVRDAWDCCSSNSGWLAASRGAGGGSNIDERRRTAAAEVMSASPTNGIGARRRVFKRRGHSTPADAHEVSPLFAFSYAPTTSTLVHGRSKCSSPSSSVLLPP